MHVCWSSVVQWCQNESLCKFKKTHQIAKFETAARLYTASQVDVTQNPEVAFCPWA